MRARSLVLLLAAGCGGYDNVGVCEDFVASLDCGENEGLADRLDCEAWAEEDGCDLKSYFECLEKHTACDESGDEPVLDLSGWAACADLAVCE